MLHLDGLRAHWNLWGIIGLLLVSPSPQLSSGGLLQVELSSLFLAGGSQLSVEQISQLSSLTHVSHPWLWEPPAGAGAAPRALCLDWPSLGLAVQIVLVDQALHFCAPLLSSCKSAGTTSLWHSRGRFRRCLGTALSWWGPCRHCSQGWNGFARADTEEH